MLAGDGTSQLIGAGTASGGYLLPGMLAGQHGPAWVPTQDAHRYTPPASPPPPSVESPSTVSLGAPPSPSPVHLAPLTNTLAAATDVAARPSCALSSAQKPPAAHPGGSVTSTLALIRRTGATKSPSASNAPPAAPTSPQCAPVPPAAAPSPPSAVPTSALADPAPPQAVSPSARPPRLASQQKAVSVNLGPGGAVLMRTIATLERQLIEGHRGPVKLTGFYAVLEAATGGQDNDAKSIIIDCYGASRTVEQKDAIMDEWRQRRAGLKSSDSKHRDGVKDVDEGANHLREDSGTESGDDDGDAASSNTASDVFYPEMTIYSAALLRSVATAVKETKTLSSAELGAVLKMCGLRSYKQMTYNLVKAILKKAFVLLKSRGVRKGNSSWSLVTPPDLLFNMWRLEGAPVTADGGCFFAPGHTNSSQNGGIDKKRFALCVAAHICPFWSAILRGCFMENPLNKVAVSKRFRGADDAFAGAGRKRGGKKPLLKLKKKDGTDKVAVENGGGKESPEPSDVDDPAGSIDLPTLNEQLPLAMASISELAKATALYTMVDLLFLDPSPVLPSTKLVAVESLPAADFEIVCREKNELRVLLPRTLIKKSFHLLTTAGGSGGSGGALSVDVSPTSSASAAETRSGDAPSKAITAGPASVAGPRRALRFTVGKYAPMRCSTTTLINMSAVHSLKEQLAWCSEFLEWLEAMKASRDGYPRELEFLVGSTLTVAAAADFLWSSCVNRRVGDPAWRFSLLGAGSHWDKDGSWLYGGCTVAYSDVVYGGQRKYMTNGVLDAALVKMRMHSVQRSSPAYVLLTGQSASFTVCRNTVVEEAVAIEKIKEIYNVVPTARYQRFIMLLNLGQHHWISAEVVPAAPVGKIHIFDSSVGGFRKEKELAVSRVKLFAREVDRSWHMGNTCAPVVNE